MSTAELPERDFPAFSQELRRNLYSAPRFTLPFSGGMAEFCPYTMEGVVQGATLTIGGEVLSHQSGPIPIEEFGERVNNWKLPPLPTLKAEGAPQRVTVAGAVERIDNAHSETVFYTGAGISNAGEYPVYDHLALGQQLGFVDEDFVKDLEAIIINDRFVHGFMASSAFCQEVVEGYETFIGNMFKNATTPAHIAIASIIRHYDMQPTLFTSNYDVKHEATQSSLLATKVVRGWHSPERGGAEGQRVRTVINEIAERACRLLVVSGTANDTRGMFKRLKIMYPDMAMLAINQADPNELSYLGDGDFYLGGDAHQLLPTIAERIVKA